MANQLIFHRLVQKDMNGIRDYYREEGGPDLADRFYDAFLSKVAKAVANPRRYPPNKYAPELRGAEVDGFPYHFLYRETATGIRILVLRHDSRHWHFGLRRK
jgi:plasmid stabilization system protein ParE